MRPKRPFARALLVAVLAAIGLGVLLCVVGCKKPQATEEEQIDQGQKMKAFMQEKMKGGMKGSDTGDAAGTGAAAGE